MRQLSKLLTTVAIFSALTLTVDAAAQTNAPLSLEYQLQARPQEVPRDPDGYWTQTELQRAAPEGLPIPGYAQSIATIAQLEQTLDSMNLAVKAQVPPGTDGEPFVPAQSPQVNNSDVLAPTAAPLQLPQANVGAVIFDVGNLGAPFSSSRFVPQSARLEYPYRVTGKLFFKTPQGSSWCSAAVLRPRIILTAGHCVHRGSGGAAGFYSNWLFVPALENNQAPFQAWNWRYVVTTSTWMSGGGTVPNAGDWAIIELEDRMVGNQMTRIGQWLGYLGYHTGVLPQNHVKMIGYPGNFDTGSLPHQVDSQSFRSGGSNTWLYGSDARGGSSGGSWIMNFGTQSAGQTGGQQPWPNRVIGVTSYGYIATGPMVQGASVFNDEFITLLTTACAHRMGNCTP